MYTTINTHWFAIWPFSRTRNRHRSEVMIYVGQQGSQSLELNYALSGVYFTQKARKYGVSFPITQVLVSEFGAQILKKVKKINDH